MKRVVVMMAAVLLTLSGSSWADALRCGTSIVETGASTEELVAQCGEPDSKSIEGMTWTYTLGDETWEVRVSEAGVVAEIKQLQ